MASYPSLPRWVPGKIDLPACNFYKAKPAYAGQRSKTLETGLTLPRNGTRRSGAPL
jgi:hypothetical protein